MMQPRQFFSYALLAMILVSSSAAACSCRTASLSERIAGAQIILVAKVTGFVPLHQVTFSSKEVFKGRPGTVLTVPTGVSDCDLFLPPIKPRTGDEYLLRRWLRSNAQSSAK